MRLALAAFAVLASTTLAGACTVPANIDAERATVIKGINAVRASRGLGRLAPNAVLTDAAQRHACDMAQREKLSHTGSSGSSLGGRLRSVGYDKWYANENIAQSSGTAAVAVQLWMASAPHKANILANEPQDAGVGLAISPSGRKYWVFDSAAPRR